MSRIAITGGSGFIGSNLAERLSRDGHDVLNIDIRPPRNPDAGGAYEQLDILDRQGLIGSISRFNPHTIFHLAARTDLHGSHEAEYPANIQGVSNVIAAARSCTALEKTFFASSMYVCRLGYIPLRDDDYCPHTNYGKSKVIGEQIVRREMGDRNCWTILRPTSIWGPWFGIPYISFFHAVRKGMYFHPKGYSIRRSYGFVLNTVQQLLRLMECEDTERVHGKVFYLADYEPTDSRAWAKAIAKSFGARRIYEAPLGLMKIGAGIGDLFKKMGVREFPLTTFRLNNMLIDVVFDLSQLQEIDGAQPYTLQEGVALTADWMRRYVIS